MKSAFVRRWLAVLLTLTMCLSLAPAALADDPDGSGGSGDSGDSTSAPALTGIGVSISGDESVVMGGSAKVKATVTYEPNDADLTGLTPTFEWISSDTSVVTVTGDTDEPTIGVAGVGDAKIAVKATCGNFTAEAEHAITVSAAPAPAHVFTVTPSAFTVRAGTTTQLSANLSDVGAQPSVTWTSSDPSKATVSGGTVRGVAAGTVTITATCNYDNQTYTAQATGTVEPPAAAAVERLTLNRNSIILNENERDQAITATVLLVAGTSGEVVPEWESSDESVVTVTVSNDGKRGTLVPKKPGESRITVTAGDKTATCDVTVSGIDVDTAAIELKENEEWTLPTAKSFGNAGTVSFISEDNFIARVEGNIVVGLSIGTTRLRVTDNKSGGRYDKYIDVTVEADPSTTIQAGTLERGKVLYFGSGKGSNGISIWNDLRNQLNGGLDYVIGLNVDTSQGTLYYRYLSEAEPGAGVAGQESFYISPTVGQKGLEDVTFVPKPDFAGGQVTISYNGVSNGKTYTCKILLTVDPGNGTSSGISLTTPYNTAVRFSSTEFNRVCQEQTGTQLNYVTFSLPPERQGTLYTNYAGDGNYGSVVTLRSQYARKDLDDVWFVPAPGFEGTMSVYYTGRSIGATGYAYTGKVDITVSPEGGVDIGGLAYDVASGGVANFDDVDFNDYCHDVLSTGQTLSYIRFDSLPSSSQGTLYYDYRSSSNTGTRASAGYSYYYGTRTPRIDRLTFAPADGFTGTIRIPFTGWSTSGVQFTGNVEINVRGGTGYGDIRYTCKPGQQRSFNDSDFNSLCRDLTNSGLNYIQFQGLPNSTDGTIYYSSTSNRVNINTRYYNGSSRPRIDDLFFRASNSFSGSVDIEFIGYATSGETFHGVLTIESSSSGSSSQWDIHYSATTKEPAVFQRADFDDLSQWETDRDVSTVRFDIPSTSQGDLYRNYRSTSSKGTRISSSSTSISASDLSRVAFVPASGYTGTVAIDFTARSTNGDTFEGVVEIEVEQPGADVTARYSTRVSPVRFRAEDFRRSGYTLSSIRFASMPSTSAGYLYYQYTSPTRYGRQASTGTSYSVNGSNLISELTFVPRAGFTGTVTLPYTGTNSNNSTFQGEVVITVSPTYTSSRFNDLGSYSDQQRAAVDFLYENDITQGISSSQYGPEYSITRGDFAVMVYKAFDLAPMGSGRFNDVPSSAYYAQAVDTLSAMGIVSGIGGGAYGPDYTLTREDAICMIQRAMRAVGWSANDGSSSYLSSFSDGGSVSGYARGAMANAVQMGYLPTTGGRLDPARPLTRIDMASIIHRVLTY